LPEIKEDRMVDDVAQIVKPLFKHRNFTNAIVAQFFYVAAQVSIAAWFINYCTENNIEITNAHAANLLSISLILFTAGRFAGTALMRKIAANRLLFIFALVNILLCVLVVLNQNWLSVYSLIAIFFFESIMFPTIFALGVKDLGHHTKKSFVFYNHVHHWRSGNALFDGTCSGKIFYFIFLFYSGDLFCCCCLVRMERLQN
jgi:FHS family L-fucose permease-like MFS transporter